MGVRDNAQREQRRIGSSSLADDGQFAFELLGPTCAEQSKVVPVPKRAVTDEHEWS